MTSGWGNMIGQTLLAAMPTSLWGIRRLDDIRAILIPEKGERVTVHSESPVFVIAAGAWRKS